MSSKIQRLTTEVAGGIAIYAMMSANSYKRKPGRTRFHLKKLGWKLVDVNGKTTNKPTKEHTFSGLAYNIYEKKDSNKVVFAFRGSDSKRDYLWGNLAIPPFHLQYWQARKAIKKYLSKNKNKNVVATGHSLGGGLALSVSLHHGIKAFTFDPSPRVFDGIKNMNKKAERIIVYQKGDILQLARKVWKKDDKAVDKKNVFKCDYVKIFKGKSPHRGDLLAKGILAEGASVNTNLNVKLAYTVK